MLDMRRRAEAEGETRIMGSGRRVGLVVMGRGRGTLDGVWWARGSLESGRCLMNVAADFRTCEKSYGELVLSYNHDG